MPLFKCVFCNTVLNYKPATVGFLRKQIENLPDDLVLAVLDPYYGLPIHMHEQDFPSTGQPVVVEGVPIFKFPYIDADMG